MGAPNPAGSNFETRSDSRRTHCLRDERAGRLTILCYGEALPNRARKLQIVSRRSRHKRPRIRPVTSPLSPNDPPPLRPSYAGKQVIGPFKSFQAVIGPNGAGKSNLFDAISFVLGVKSRHLRSQKLSDLVFRANGSAPARRRASVKLVYRLDDGEVEGMEVRCNMFAV